jgi:ketosteroid isomerase-like protein
MPQREAVLFANEAFYAAFVARDMAAMARVWSSVHPVTCTHPGWQTLHGREAVMESWRAILANRNAPQIRCRDEAVTIHGETAIVTCLEQITAAQFLAATNVFVKEGAIWCMVHHHAGPANVDPRTLTDDEKPKAN